jgi:integrase
VARRRLPSDSDLNRILWDLYFDVIEAGERDRASRREGENPYVAEEPQNEEEWNAYPLQPEDRAIHVRGSLQMNSYLEAEKIVNKMLAARGLKEPPPTDDYRRFLRNAMYTLAAAYDADTALEEGELPELRHPLFPAQSTDAISPLHPSARHSRLLISEAVEEYLSYKQTARRTRAATAGEQRGIARLFTALMGDSVCLQVRRQDAAAYREMLLGMPANYGRGRYQGLSPADCIAVRRDIEQALKREGEPVRVNGWKMTREEAEAAACPMARGTINKHLDFFSGLFRWLEEQYFQGLQNPFRGLRFSKADAEADASTRQPWSADDLAALFASPVWRGCIDENRRAKQGERVFEDHRFWVPLIALFSGLRESEICGLAVDDIEWHEGAGCWTITLGEPEGRGSRIGSRRHKNQQSQRVVPVHDELIRLGFERYIRAVREAGHERLFPVLQPTGARQSYGIQFTKWFNRYRADIGLGGPLRDFHALRHNFTTALDPHLKHDRKLKQRIIGHKTGLDTIDRYWHLDPAVLRPLVNKVSHGLDLSHLYPGNQPHRETLFHDGSRAEGRRRAAKAIKAKKARNTARGAAA